MRGAETSREALTPSLAQGAMSLFFRSSAINADSPLQKFERLDPSNGAIESDSIPFVKKVLLALVLGILLCDAAGVMAFISPEECTAVTDTLPDGKCPPLCARCACGVPSLAPSRPMLSSALLVPTGAAADVTSAILDTPPHEILHVPK